MGALTIFAAMWLGMFALTILVLELPAFNPRWAQGWLIPHEKPVVYCRVQCSTCRLAALRDER